MYLRHDSCSVECVQASTPNSTPFLLGSSQCVIPSSSPRSLARLGLVQRNRCPRPHPVSRGRRPYSLSFPSFSPALTHSIPTLHSPSELQSQGRRGHWSKRCPEVREIFTMLKSLGSSLDPWPRDGQSTVKFRSGTPQVRLGL
jgi:hypothetical protein